MSSDFFTLDPEVPGFGILGEDEKGAPHFEIDVWLRDELLCEDNYYFGTEKLKKALESSDLSGVEYQSCKVSLSDQRKEMEPDLILPDFFWIKITGVAGKDDFGISESQNLIVSKKALEVLRKSNIDNCDVNPFP